MSTPVWVAVGVGAYLLVLVWVFSLLAMAKRGDQAVRGPLEWRRSTPAGRHRQGRLVEATSDWLVRRTADVQAVLGVERIGVAIRDDADPHSWVVEACAGVPGLCGAVIDAPSARDPAYLVADDAEPGRAWRTVSIPVIVGGDVVGAVSLATRRTWGLGRHDMELVERFARMVARDLGASRGTAEDRSGDTRGAA